MLYFRLESIYPLKVPFSMQSNLPCTIKSIDMIRQAFDELLVVFKRGHRPDVTHVTKKTRLLILLHHE